MNQQIAFNMIFNMIKQKIETLNKQNALTMTRAH